MRPRQQKATSATSLRDEQGRAPRHKVVKTIAGSGSKAGKDSTLTDTGASESDLVRDFDPDFKILDDVMDRDAEAFRALAK